MLFACFDLFLHFDFLRAKLKHMLIYFAKLELKSGVN